MDINEFPKEPKSQFFLPGPVGKLEVLTTWPYAVARGVAIICHPHPLYSGTMNNKVVTTIAKAMEELGLATVRFNFRGVGKSEGSYGEMRGEIEDLKAVKQWVNRMSPDLPVWLAGFSFGSYIAAMVANMSTDVVSLITVAPAVTHANFNQLVSIKCPWLILQGGKDEVVSYDAVREFVGRSPVPVTFITIPDATHFFHGQLLELRTAILEGVKNQTSKDSQ